MISSVFLVLAMRAGGIILWLLTTLVLARTVSVEEFGLTLLAINIVLLFGHLSLFGADVSVLRYCSTAWKEAEKPNFRSEFRQGKWIALAGGVCAIVVVSLIVVFKFVEDARFTTTSMILIAFCIVVTGQIAVQRTALRSAGRIGEAMLAESLLRTLITLAICGLAALFGYLSFLVFLIAYAIALSVGWLSQIFFLSRLDLLTGASVRVQSRVKFAMMAWPGDAALVSIQRMPGVLIGVTIDLTTAAVFLAAERVAQSGVFLIDAVRTVIGPDIAAAKGAEQQAAISLGSSIMFLAGTTGAVLTLLMGAAFVYLLGDAYTDALPIIAILLLGQFSYAVLGPTAIIMNMYGLAKIRSFVAVASALILVVLIVNTSTVHQVAWSYSAVLWLMNLVLAFIIWKKLGHYTGLSGVRRSDLVNAIKEIQHTAVAKFRKRENNNIQAK